MIKKRFRTFDGHKQVLILKNASADICSVITANQRLLSGNQTAIVHSTALPESCQEQKAYQHSGCLVPKK